MSWFVHTIQCKLWVKYICDMKHVDFLGTNLNIIYNSFPPNSGVLRVVFLLWIYCSLVHCSKPRTKMSENKPMSFRPQQILASDWRPCPTHRQPHDFRPHFALVGSVEMFEHSANKHDLDEDIFPDGVLGNPRRISAPYVYRDLIGPFQISRYFFYHLSIRI